MILPDLEVPDVGGRQPRVGAALGLFGPWEKEAALRCCGELLGTDAAIQIGSRRRRVRDEAHMERAYPKETVDALPVEESGTLWICRRIISNLLIASYIRLACEDLKGANLLYQG
ncbi:hypothetical protein FPV16_07775 [Methylobacterium sp. W2]|uniref:hypothetical protein n=1 Tax=Methylobacterium sp. W2 TaxID=2598107 RepID=UPI001D0C90C0|nr:hypothetical protein [Methylobacterium sp. W2]MCC0806115.1 hypothetical protein [Methylobacterium sp. W2]